MQPLKLCFLFFLAAIYSCTYNTQSLIPQLHSGKWIDGREVSSQEKDSILVKMVYLYPTAGFHVFQIEVINLSYSKEFLVDPSTFEGKWYLDKDFSRTPVECNRLIPLDRSNVPSYEGVYPAFYESALKMNTLEPGKSVFGYLTYKGCSEESVVNMFESSDRRTNTQF
jgi:hypothetical protein